MGMGRIKGKGVFPPEGCVNPMDMFELVQAKLKRGGGSTSLTVEHIDHRGRSEKMDFLSAAGG
jgi:hypothetical protein